MTSFEERLRSGPPLLLDAAMGSDLDRRGLPTTLPLWSAVGLIENPALVRQIHRENLLAGADIITTNTFRTTERTLRAAGLDPGRATELDALAVALATQARRESGWQDAFIGGSIAPLEDCYLPVFETPAEVALAEHRVQAQSLAAGVDFLMIETMPTGDEARIALQAAKETGLPVTVGFVCAALGDDGAPVRLLSGETLAEVAERVTVLEPAAIFVNCAAPEVITAALRELRRVTDLPLGGYANAGHVDERVGWAPDERLTGEIYADEARQWLELGARVIGGCCGTRPVHTAALRKLIDREFGD